MTEPRSNPLKNPDGTMRSITDISIVPDGTVTIVCNGTASGSFVESIGGVSVQTDHGRRLLDYLRARERKGRA